MAAIFGREGELEALGSFLDGLEDGPAALVLEGNAGAGKTTLWSAALEAAHARSLRTLSTRAAENETTLSFTGLGDLLDGLLDEFLGELPEPQRRALEIALLVDEARGAPPEQRTVGVAVLAAVRVLARVAPLVIAIDDVQWLDAPSATVLQFASRRLQDEQVGLLVAQRTDDAAGVPLGLERGLPDGRLTRLVVGPLTLESLGRLLHDRLDAAFSRPVVRLLHEASGGNAFFALELARALERGTIALEPGEPLPVPATLRELVRTRLAALPPATRRALPTVAALSAPTVALVEAALQVDAMEVLRPALDADVIELERDRIRFSHPLLASGAYATVGPRQRREVHARLALSVDEPEERARHLALGTDGHDAEAAAALDEVARGARARGAPTTAAELYERARSLTPPEDEKQTRRRALDAAFHHFESGDSRRARTLLEELLRAVPAGPERARVLIRLARVRSYDDDLRAATGLFRQAIGEAGEDRAARAAAHEGLSASLFRLRERLSESVEHADAAERLARELGNTDLLAEILMTRVLSEGLLGREQAAATLEAALALQESSEDLRVLAQPALAAGAYWWWTDELERARATFEHLYRRAHELGDESSLPYVLVLLGQVECPLGDFASAARHADEGYEAAEQAGQATLRAYLLALRALADAYLGDVEAATEDATTSLALARETSGTPAEHVATAALGLLELSLGDPGEAARHLGPLVAYVRSENLSEPGATRFVAEQVEALIALGRHDEAAELLGWYEGNAVRLGRTSAIAASHRCRGLLAAAASDAQGALAAYERALSQYEALPMPFERARTLLLLGAAQRRAKQKRAARATLEHALATFTQLGAKVWADNARAELGRISGRAPRAGGLTPTERRIAELVAEGRTNREVAAVLFLSDRTVEGHLSRIYGKLGVRSRTELARLDLRATAP